MSCLRKRIFAFIIQSKSVINKQFSSHANKIGSWVKIAHTSFDIYLTSILLTFCLGWVNNIISIWNTCSVSINHVFSADKSSNAFAYNPTSSAVKLSWDSFLSDDKRRRLRRSASEVIEAINIEATFEVSDLMSSLFTAEELSSMIYNETIPLGTSAELQNLTSGLRYKIVVTAINGLGEKMENKSLTTEAVTGLLCIWDLFRLCLTVGGGGGWGCLTYWGEARREAILYLNGAQVTKIFGISISHYSPHLSWQRV